MSRRAEDEDEVKRINDHYEGENNDIEFRALKKSAGLKEQSEQLGCITMPRLLMVSGVRVRAKKNSPNRAYRIHSSCNRSQRLELEAAAGAKAMLQSCVCIQLMFFHLLPCTLLCG